MAQETDSSGIPLGDFIRLTLLEIQKGAAIKFPDEAGTERRIVPRLNQALDSSAKVILNHDGHPIVSVEFDLVVTQSSRAGSAGGVGVVASFVALGHKGEKEHSLEAVNRIKFSIPIVLR
jgi:hypothetical protein